MPDPTGYLREVLQELKKVSWPSRTQTYSKTFLVIGVSIIVSIFIAILDYVFQYLLGVVI